MDILEATRHCYDTEAENFSASRERYRPEIEMIIDALPDQRPLRIADLGCGGGRLYDHIATAINPEQFNYIGVDYAEGMIELAAKQHPDAGFSCETMRSFLTTNEQDSLDAIICLASLQHIFPAYERELHFHYLYNSLTYGGRCILVNWSFSSWFFRTYWQQIVTGLGRSIVQPTRRWNDYLIPRRSPTRETNYTRYYHIFTLAELEELARLSGFIVVQSGYTSSAGELHKNWLQARNTFLVLEKTV